MAVDHNNPQSRDEEILIATIDGTEYNKNPQSRMEELLLELKEVIEEGGGGGTTDYENLSNKPQINGHTLSGDLTGADLDLVDAEEGKGLSTNDYDDTEKAAVAAATSAISAMKDGSEIDSFGDVEVALLDKQDELTAGKYIQFINDEISVKRDIAYEADEVFFAEQTNNGLHVLVTIGSTTLYEENFVTSDPNHTVLDLVQISFSVRAVRWIVKYLKASKTRSAGTEEVVWPSVTDTFVTTVDADKKLIIQSEMDAAINSAVSKCYHHAGTKTVAQLTHDLLVAANEGNVYEITDSGTTTSDFMEGIGHPIKEGDNVGVARVSEGVYKFDLLSGFVDTSNFVQKSSTAGLIMNDGTIDTVAKQPVTDNNLTTTDKTTTGAVNELKSGLTNLDNEVNGDATVYPYADVITIEDAVPSNLADCSVKIEPVQDLHGYANPWVGGAGKNKCKTMSASTTSNGVSFILNDDGTITANRTSTSENNAYVALPSVTLPAGTYKFSGCDGGFDTGYWIDFNYNSTSHRQYTEELTATFTEETTVSPWLNVYASYNAQNKVFSPMIRIDGTTSTYEPYSNICPITGHTEVDVQRDGKNILPSDIVINNGYYNDEGTIVESDRTGHSNLFMCKSNTSYICTISATNPQIIGVNGKWGIYCWDANKSFISKSACTWESTQLNVTTPQNCKYMSLQLPINESATEIGLNIALSQLEEGTTPTDFVPYSGKTYTIALGSTIYGGTVDFDSGVMTVTRKYYTITSMAQTNEHFFYISSNETKHSQTTIDEIISDKLPTGNVDSQDCIFVNQYGAIIVITTNAYASVSDLMDYLGGSCNVCFTLKDYITVQLTPQQIQLLKGTNTISASTGQISVTVNGVSDAIGQVQEQVNGLAEEVADVQNDLTALGTTIQSAGASTSGCVVKYVQIGKLVIVMANIVKGSSSWNVAHDLPRPLVSGYVGYTVDNYLPKYPLYMNDDNGTGRLQVRTGDTIASTEPVYFSYVAL